MLFHPLLCAFFQAEWPKWELRIYNEGSVCVVYHPTGYVTINVPFTEQIFKLLDPCTVHSWSRTEQVRAPLFPVYLNVEPCCSWHWKWPGCYWMSVEKFISSPFASLGFCELMTIDFGRTLGKRGKHFYFFLSGSDPSHHELLSSPYCGH